MKHYIPGNCKRPVARRWLSLLILAVLTVWIIGKTDEMRAEGASAVFPQPILITSPGQNADGLMVKVVVQKLNLDYQYLPQAKEKDLKSVKSVIMTVGVSNKGLGASGISYDEELKRTRTLVASCNENKCPIIFAYLGGKARRGGKSDQLIHEVAPYAACLIITQDSDEDRYFTNLSQQKQIPLKVAEKIGQIENILKELYAGQK